VGTVGRIHPHLEVKIVDAEGRIVPRGETGELLTRGYSVMLGYWGDEARTREAVDAAGWMHTGDLATLDADGYCRIVGRAKDMVIRGGENIYPREVEEFLYRHPKVLDVQCVGVPDTKYGEELCACIVLRPGEQADPALCALRGRFSDDGHGQDPEVHAAPADGRGIGTRRLNGRRSDWRSLPLPQQEIRAGHKIKKHPVTGKSADLLAA
jgi:acyl-CoA synthetase (AMP-forming)/AMP-acid ligase II